MLVLMSLVSAVIKTLFLNKQIQPEHPNSMPSAQPLLLNMSIVYLSWWSPPPWSFESRVCLFFVSAELCSPWKEFPRNRDCNKRNRTKERIKHPLVSNSITTSLWHQIFPTQCLHWDTLLLRLLPRLLQPADSSSNAAGNAASFGTVLWDSESGVLLDLQCYSLGGEVERRGLLISQWFLNMLPLGHFPPIRKKNNPCQYICMYWCCCCHN